MKPNSAEDKVSPTQYRYRSSAPEHTHAYLLGEVERFLTMCQPAKLFELGCGNGAVAAWVAGRGVQVAAIDSSESGIKIARQEHSQVSFERASAYDDLAARFGTFPAVISLEVIEHLYEPRRMVANLYSLLDPGGCALISTPYHGYWKNLALALMGKMDAHYTSLWDGGHIKFWSVRTMTRLLEDAGFVDLNFKRVGRVPALAKSLVVIARKPTGNGT
jgi:2-polyprenyl-3-methyl-5-hydroxy-6-metoxy-1,4-benzoquinol methylase